MEIGKLGLFVISLVVIVCLIAIVALAVPDFGNALRDFGMNTLGPSAMGTLTSIVTVPLAWGGTTLLYGVIVIVGIIGAWTIVWTLVLKVAFSKVKTKLGFGTANTNTGSANTVVYKEPQTVIVREVAQSVTGQPAQVVDKTTAS
jgi:hypothetical protein